MKRFLFTFTNSRILTIFGIVFLLLGLVLALIFLSEEPPVENQGPPSIKMPDIVRRATTPPKPPLPPLPAKKREPLRDKKRPTSPVEIPDEIEEGDVTDFGIDYGVEGGVEGGVAGGVLGGILGAAPSAPPEHYRKPASCCLASRHNPSFNTEEYERIYENRFLDAVNNPLSTFSIDVDTASYANMRRFLKNNQFPPKDAVRTEELINYFNYDYPEPTGPHPFSIVTEVASCPWNDSHKLLHIGLKGKKTETSKLPSANLVFLLDVSGSMDDRYKLPLLKSSFRLLVNQARVEDSISIVVYAGAAGLVLPPTPGNEKEKILRALGNLHAGGTTAGGAGIRLAYKIAEQNFIKSGNNRVILATDGDFNIGVSSTSELTRLIEEKRKTGILLTVLGFGMGNYKDHRMETLADKGNGNYYYIDSILEGKKVFVDEMRATLFTIAKDVKIQVEFNPAKVNAYRLVGYENRKLAKEDFKDDTKDAGELGSGHTVTALYEIIPAGSKEKTAEVDELKFQETKIKKEAFESDIMAYVKLRYKEPDGVKSKLMVKAVSGTGSAESSDNFRFSAAVAQLGMLLRESEYKGDSTFEGVLKLALSAKGNDPYGYRSEFIKLVETCQLLQETR